MDKNYPAADGTLTTKGLEANLQYYQARIETEWLVLRELQQTRDAIWETLSLQHDKAS